MHYLNSKTHCGWFIDWPWLEIKWDVRENNKLVAADRTKSHTSNLTWFFFFFTRRWHNYIKFCRMIKFNNENVIARTYAAEIFTPDTSTGPRRRYRNQLHYIIHRKTVITNTVYYLFSFKVFENVMNTTEQVRDDNNTRAHLGQCYGYV